MAEVMSDDDEVVKEIDVFLTRGMPGSMYLVQYPMRGPGAAYDLSENLSEIRLRPKQGMMEMDIALNTDSKFYNADVQDDVKIKTQTLKSTRVNGTEGYGIGIFKDDGLHIAPVNNVLQMRPSFGYIDQSAAELKAQRRAMEREIEKDEEPEGEPEERKRTTVSMQLPVKRRETERMTEAKKSSYAFLKAKEDEEPWGKYSYVDEEDERAQEFLRTMPVGAGSGPIASEKMLPREFVEYLKPDLEGEIQGEEVDSSAPLSRAALSKMSLDKQVLALLKSVNCLTFSRLVTLTNSQKREQDLLNILVDNAVLLRGVWVARSEILYDDEPTCLARDYLIQLFRENTYVQKKDYTEDIGIGSSTGKEILVNLAQLRVGKGWEFKVPPDTDFVQSHTDLEARMSAKWSERAVRVDQYVRNIKTLKAEGKMPKQSQGSSKKASPSDVGAAAGTSYVGAEPSKDLAAVMEAVFEDIPVITKSRLLSRLAKRGATLPRVKELVASSSDAVIAATLDSIAVRLINGAYALRKGRDSGLEQYRNLVLSMYGERSAMKKKEIQVHVQRSLGQDMPQSAYSKILKELAKSKGSMWTVKSGEEDDD